MFTKGQTSELGGVTSSNIPSPLYLFLKVLPPVYYHGLQIKEMTTLVVHNLIILNYLP